MTDITNQQIAKAEGQTGLGKVGSGIISGLLASYIMNQASLHGVDFQLLGISSELIKSSIEGLLVGVFVWMTPSHFAAAVTDGIVFIKATAKQWRDAWNSN